MASIWHDGASANGFPTLGRDIRADILVIGGGMAGVLCAHRLQEAGARVVVAEARTIGSGITKNTTAKITAQHGLLYAKLAKQRGHAIAQGYLEANLRAVDMFAVLCEKIRCGFERRPARGCTVKQNVEFGHEP